MKITIDVALESGAKVSLTKDQEKSVENHVRSLLFPPRTATTDRPKKKFAFGARRWEDAERRRILEETRHIAGKSLHEKAVELGEAFRRTPKAVLAQRNLMLNRIANGQSPFLNGNDEQ